MTKAELIAENKRLKKTLKDIYKLTSLKPLSKREKEDYETRDYGLVFASHLGKIQAHVKITLVPDWVTHTEEEITVIINSL